MSDPSRELARSAVSARIRLESKFEREGLATAEAPTGFPMWDLIAGVVPKGSGNYHPRMLPSYRVYECMDSVLALGATGPPPAGNA